MSLSHSVGRGAVALTVLVGFATPAAFAATGNVDMNVTANVDPYCEIVVTDMAFGAFAPGATEVSQTSTLTSTCVNGTTYTVTIDGGQNHLVGGSIGNNRHRMKDVNGNFLPYILSKTLSTVNVDNRFTLPGDTVVGPVTEDDGVANVTTIYGRIVSAESETVPLGDYADVVGLTVTY